MHKYNPGSINAIKLILSLVRGIVNYEVPLALKYNLFM